MHMKKFQSYFTALFFTAASILLPSCDNDESYSIGDIAVDWVTVHVEADGLYTFTGDTWGTMFPAATSLWGYRPTEGERAYLIFNPLYDNYGGYDVGIKPERIYPILTKNVEDLTKENDKEFADHPVHLRTAQISGGYMTIIFDQKIPQTKKHWVNLVKNPEEEVNADGYIHLEYRYNTYGDTLNVYQTGIVAFNLQTLPIKEAKGIKLKINDAKKGKTELIFEKTNTAATPTENDLNELSEELK